MQPAKKLHPGIVALIIIALVAIAATAVIVVNQNSNENDTTTNTTQVSENEGPSETEAVNTNSSTDTSAYADGTYSATGSYSSPGGRESIELSVTIKDGVITGTSLETDPASRDSRTYQASFASGYKDLVVGKSVDEVSLSRVAGSSLTSNGFNDALDQIKSDAKA